MNKQLWELQSKQNKKQQTIGKTKETIQKRQYNREGDSHYYKKNKNMSTRIIVSQKKTTTQQ